jgi:hypothetical protein
VWMFYCTKCALGIGSFTIAIINSTPFRTHVLGENKDHSNQYERRISSPIEKLSDCGIGLTKSGSYFFIVEKYCGDAARFAKHIV